MLHLPHRDSWKSIPVAAMVLLLSGIGSLGCRRQRVDLTVFYATSLSAVLGDLAAAYQTQHPNTHARLEPSGSQVAARKVSEQGMKADVVAVADARLIDKMLIPKHASWNAVFATNEIVIAHKDHSRFTDQITESNWAQILTRPEVRLGRADPDTAPIGYNTLFVWQLAEKSGKLGGDGAELTKRLLARCAPEHVTHDEAELLALLESRAVDYAFLFRSTAEDHHLKTVALPPEINLSRLELAADYARAQVEIRMKQGDGRSVLTGTPVTYGVTIPSNAPQAAAAADFLAFVLGPDGARALARRGFRPVSPPTCGTCTGVPAALLSRFAPVPR
jgi:molybdate/tungstate transport system substrate-binding protein